MLEIFHNEIKILYTKIFGNTKIWTAIPLNSTLNMLLLALMTILLIRCFQFQYSQYNYIITDTGSIYVFIIIIIIQLT